MLSFTVVHPWAVVLELSFTVVLGGDLVGPAMDLLQTHNLILLFALF